MIPNLHHRFRSQLVEILSAPTSLAGRTVAETQQSGLNFEDGLIGRRPLGMHSSHVLIELSSTLLELRVESCIDRNRVA